MKLALAGFTLPLGEKFALLNVQYRILFKSYLYLVAGPSDDHVDDGGDEDAGHGEGRDELPAEEPVRVRPAPSHQLDVVRKPE